MIYWPENCRGGMGEFCEANRFKVDWAWSGLWQRRMKTVLLGRFALEAEYFSSMAEVLKVAVDWIESLEMECGWSPFWGRPEATAGWRGHGASPTMHFLGPFCSPRKSPSGRTSPTCPQCFPGAGIMPWILPEWHIKAVQKCKQARGWWRIGRTCVACGQSYANVETQPWSNHSGAPSLSFLTCTMG